MVLTRRLHARRDPRRQWDGRCTFCGRVHPVHSTVRLAPWVRAVNVKMRQRLES